MVAVVCMAGLFWCGLLWGQNALDLMVLWKVLSLTLWVLTIRAAGWFFRHVLHPHEVLRIFLHLMEWSVVLVTVLPGKMLKMVSRKFIICSLPFA